MATRKRDMPIPDPLQFLVQRPLCEYPDMARFIVSLGLDRDSRDFLLARVHAFEHELLASGFRFYSQVSRKRGAQVLDKAFEVLALEYAKSKRLKRSG
ncbi:hypothetical protein [Reyranella sp.]|uniref:hypothetical protein n=1 Tax=Reyranella sp. TaxID=1929291 RepID=UPI003783877F